MLVRSAQACYDGATAFKAPFISGKDSLNNEFECEDGSIISIPPTLLVSAVSIVEDANNCVTMDIKESDNLLFIIGETKNELGGSHYYKIQKQLGSNVPKVDLQKAPKIAEKVAEAINQQLIESCHDCSEGGLAVTLAEMAFAGELGIKANLKGLPKSDDCLKTSSQLFSESTSRFVVEVKQEKFDNFAKLMLNLPFGRIGTVTKEKKLIIKDQNGKSVINIDNNKLKQSWQKTFNW